MGFGLSESATKFVYSIYGKPFLLDMTNITKAPFTFTIPRKTGSESGGLGQLGTVLEVYGQIVSIGSLFPTDCL